jgi:low affinity Fe/Cu permease
MNKFRFSYLARRLSVLAGRPAAFFLAVAAIVLWALSGPLFGYSDTWQLVVNTATTIITFLMVFVIQNTQNRDTALLDLEHIDDEKFERYRRSYAKLAAVARRKLEHGELDTDSPDIKDLRLGPKHSATAP